MVWRNNVEIDYADREKLFEGLAIMAKIIAKEVAKEIVVQQSKADPALPKEKLALSCTDAAKLLGVSAPTVSKMIREGKIPAIRYYRKILIPYNALKKQFSEMPDGQWVPPTV
jgi:excisionase family DNA binding protein